MENSDYLNTSNFKFEFKDYSPSKIGKARKTGSTQ